MTKRLLDRVKGRMEEVKSLRDWVGHLSDFGTIRANVN
jgi:hypothetical protein